MRKISNAVYQQRRSAEIADAIKRIKTETPCADCGQHFPYFVMDFDHLGGKVHSISEMRRRRWTLPALLREIAKCDVVCANCHRIRTQINAGRWP